MPRSSVRVLTAILVASSVRITFARGTTAPEESVTTPVNCAVYVDCAAAPLPQIKNRVNAQKFRKTLRNTAVIAVSIESGFPILKAYLRFVSFHVFYLLFVTKSSGDSEQQNFR